MSVWLGDESGKRIFVLDNAAQQSYDCSCKITDVFEGETYLAWNPDCATHREPPPRAFPDPMEEFDRKMREEMLAAVRRSASKNEEEP